MNISYSEDTFFNGRIRLRQEKQGYRFAIDAVLLAHHVHPRPEETILDLGTGCASIALMLAFRYPEIRIFGVEIQKRLAELARYNVNANRMADRITIIETDMRQLKADAVCAPVDWVVSNPPYRKAASGRINPDPQRAVAMHEIKTDMGAVIETARRMLKTGGRLVSIYPAQRITDFLTQLRGAGIEPKRIRMVHSHTQDEACLVIVEALKGGRPGAKVSRPLYIYETDGAYTPEVQKMFAPQEED